MIKLPKIVAVAAIAASLAAGGCSAPLSEGEASEVTSEPADESHEVTGFWRHDELVSSGGDEIPLAGVFLFQDGVFIQQAVMDTPTAKNSEAMAHTGPYTITEKGVQLTAAPTIGISITGENPLSYQASTEHDITAQNTGDNLTLTFGSGTVQTFTRIPMSGKATIYNFGNGRLALSDDRFVLVAGNQNDVVTGYGTYTRSGDDIVFSADRWAESTDKKAEIEVDAAVEGTFDDSTLKIGDHVFTVAS